MSEIPVYDSRQPNEEEKALAEWFADVEKKQVDFLDQVGKRIIELSTGMLGLLFAVTAFGKDFPPPYLQNHTAARLLVIIVLLSYVGALLLGFITVQPRRYEYRKASLTEMRAVRAEVIAYKSHWFQFGSILFGVGSVCLALLVGIVLLEG